MQALVAASGIRPQLRRLYKKHNIYGTTNWLLARGLQERVYCICVCGLLGLLGLLGVAIGGGGDRERERESVVDINPGWLMYLKNINDDHRLRCWSSVLFPQKELRELRSVVIS